MVALVLPESSFPGHHPQEARGVLTNCYAEPLGDGDKRYPRVPGMKAFGQSSITGGFRGSIAIAGTLYVVQGSKVIAYPASGGGGVVLGGMVPGENRVIMARNNATVPDVVIVVPGDGARLISGSTVIDYPDEDVGQPNAVCFLKGYFVFTYSDGSSRVSAINGTAINSLDNAEAESNADGLVRPVPQGDGTLILFGTQSAEIWGGVNETGYPFSYMGTVPYGLVGPSAVSGFGDGWRSGVFFVYDGVYAWGANSPTKISPPDLDRLITDTLDKSSIEVTTYVSRGHPFVCVQSPDWSWVFDVNTQKWHLRRSHLQKNWRGTGAIYAFEKWIVGDLLSNGIYVLDGSIMNEVGEPLIMTIETAPSKDFPRGMRINRVDIDVTVGVGNITGSPNQVDPKVEISASLDGVNWTIPRIRALGQQARSRTRVNANNFGHTTGQGIRFRFSVSDEAEVSIVGADMDAMRLAA